MANLSAKELQLAAELDLQTRNQQKRDWKAIAEKVGYKSPRVAMEMAKRLKNKTSGGSGAPAARAGKRRQDFDAAKKARQKLGPREEERKEEVEQEVEEEGEEAEEEGAEKSDDEDEENLEDEEEKEVLEDEEEEEEEDEDEDEDKEDGEDEEREDEGEEGEEGQRNNPNAENREPGWWLKPVEA